MASDPSAINNNSPTDSATSRPSSQSTKVPLIVAGMAAMKDGTKSDGETIQRRERQLSAVNEEDNVDELSSPRQFQGSEQSNKEKEPINLSQHQKMLD